MIASATPVSGEGRVLRVSLHIAVHNTERHVEQPVRSVLQQTYRDFDLVLWDDGSTDGSPEILRRLAAADRRVRVLGGEHRGVLAAHAGAVAAGRGEYLGWVDSDDLLGPTALAETVAALDQQPEVGVVYTDHYEMEESGQRIRPSERSKIPYSKDRLLVDFMTFHFRLLRRSAYEAAGGLDPLQPCAVEDYDLCLRLSEHTEFLHLAKPLYYYRLRPTSFSQAHRLEQIEASAEAVRRALVRRGLADHYELTVELQARFRVRKKANAAAK